MRKLSRSFPFSLFHRRKRIDRNAVRSSYVVAPVHVEAPTTPAGVAIRCRKCNSDLFANDLDLKSVTEFFGGISVNESWEEGAEAGCMFCRLITAVWEDAKWRYELDWSRLLKIELITDGQYLLRLMNGEAKLPHILVPMTWSTITIFVKDPNLPIPLEKYKPVSPQAIDQTCLNLAKRWLSTCKDGHQRCNEKFDATGPSRLIDLRDDVIKLVLASEESNRDSYIALSHCWGDAQPLRTTLGTLARFQDEIPAHELPPTFSDAIYVARALGFTHIWIDSLCIIQDDELDWEHQSNIMASIYSNADFVLGVAAAKSANEGFLRKERPSCEGTVSLDIKGSATSFVYRAVPDNHIDIDEPLYKRGWTLQERLCASRFLAYGNWEMSWECKESSCCEHHGNTADGSTSLQRKYMFGVRMEDTRPLHLTKIWRDYIVKPYSQRSLTKPTDIPIAISALASRFQSRFQGTYLAGLWGEDLGRDLLWYTYPPGCQSSFFAPSWSWMSIELPVALEPYHTSNIQALVSKVLTEVTPSTTNPYGPVSSGTIRLTGLLIPASLEIDGNPHREQLSTLRYDISPAACWLDTPLVRTYVRLMDGTEERTTRRAMKGEESSGGPYPVTLLPILEDKHGTVGLILGRSATCIGAYQRIGRFSHRNGRFSYHHENVFERMRKDYGVCEVTLV